MLKFHRQRCPGAQGPSCRLRSGKYQTFFIGNSRHLGGSVCPGCGAEPYHDFPQRSSSFPKPNAEGSFRGVQGQGRV